jgi:hypothetical protein
MKGNAAIHLDSHWPIIVSLMYAGVVLPSVCWQICKNPPAPSSRRPRRLFTRGRRGRVLQSQIDDAGTVVRCGSSIRSASGICRGQPSAQEMTPGVFLAPISPVPESTAHNPFPTLHLSAAMRSWPERSGDGARFGIGSCGVGEKGRDSAGTEGVARQRGQGQWSAQLLILAGKNQQRKTYRRCMCVPSAAYSTLQSGWPHRAVCLWQPLDAGCLDVHAATYRRP